MPRTLHASQLAKTVLSSVDLGSREGCIPTFSLVRSGGADFIRKTSARNSSTASATFAIAWPLFSKLLKI